MASNNSPSKNFVSRKLKTFFPTAQSTAGIKCLQTKCFQNNLTFKIRTSEVRSRGDRYRVVVYRLP